MRFKNFLESALLVTSVITLLVTAFIVGQMIVNVPKHTAALQPSALDLVHKDTAAAPKAVDKVSELGHLETIVLNDSNTVIMDLEFTDQSVGTVSKELVALSKRLKPQDIIYLVLNTPGGSVDAGLKLITLAKGLPQKVKTITIFAASMGFNTVQQLDERLILPYGHLMSHPASFGVEGSTPYQINARFNWIMLTLNSMDAIAAKRMGLSLSSYQDLVHNEYWTTGYSALQEHSADRLVLARCGEFKSPTRTVRVDMLFGAIVAELPSCPLIPGYISLKADTGTSAATVERYQVLFTDKMQFISKYKINLL